MRVIVLGLIATSCCSVGAWFSLDDKSPPSAREIIKRIGPGDMHKILEPLVGKWKCKNRYWLEPGAAPVEADATCEAKWVMGRRYVEANYKGSFAGMPFEGRGVYGYDNLARKFVATWIDNMGTGIMNMEGTWNAAEKTMTWTSELVDPISGTKFKTRETDRWTPQKSWQMTMYHFMPSGKELKVMEIALTSPEQ